MDYCLSLNKTPSLNSLSSGNRRMSLGFRSSQRVSVVASSEKQTNYNNCGFSSLNTPLEPVSAEGKFLSGVLQDDLERFREASVKELVKLGAARDEAATSLSLSFDADEIALHRRIAEIKERECQVAIEDIMYLLVLHKFKDIGVHLIPKLSRCMYKGRLEIWPSKDWELESIHSFQVLEMVKEHLTAVMGWKADANVTANWERVKVPPSYLYGIYTSSILYGYFLKPASLRHRLDLSLGLTYENPLQASQPFSCGLNGHSLRCYILGFETEMLHLWAKPKTQEAVHLIQKHSCALFGDEKTGIVETNEVITTSLSSLKRLVLEAVAFGSFLWEIEEFMNSIQTEYHKLEEN